MRAQCILYMVAVSDIFVFIMISLIASLSTPSYVNCAREVR